MKADDHRAVAGGGPGLAVGVPAGEVAERNHPGLRGPAKGLVASVGPGVADDDAAVAGDGTGDAVVVTAG